MNKVLTVAAREYKAAVQTKAFIASLALMPLLMVGSIGLQLLMKRAEDRSTKTFAVVDRTPGRQVAATLEAAVKRYNEVEAFDRETGEQTRPKFELVFVEPSADDPAAVGQQRLDLSRRQQAEEFRGFLDVGPGVYDLGPATPGGPPDPRRELRFQTDKTGENAFHRWAERAVNEAIQQRRFADKGVSRELVQSIQQPVPMRLKGLTRQDPATGEIVDAPDETRVVNLLLPMGLMMLMFMLVLVGATPAMQGVVEEKQQRIAEVLLGSLTPFQLMLGKLLGVVGVALTVAAVYLGGGYAVLARYGYTEVLSGPVLAWFAVYLVLAVLVYGSLFMAIGAAAGDIKETQSLVTPVMVLISLPMLTVGAVIRDPNGPVAVAGSFFPFATPMLMIARIAVPPGVPPWQPVVGAALVLATALACVWAAGRIFRVGLLMQGKGVRLADLARWVVSG
jgi:ABC-2 type transport system permease protein